ncbi:hypothetical protein [Spongiibacter sp.]|uniref:hypothetical protein n=1 Tax=Spongiibacter sp. TaxID=2024860 RepID=UPI00356686CA
MPLADIAGEALGGALRLLGHVLVELVFEVLIKGLGYALCRPFCASLNPDGWRVTVVGLLAWVALALIGYSVYSHMSAPLAGAG